MSAGLAAEQGSGLVTEKFGQGETGGNDVWRAGRHWLGI